MTSTLPDAEGTPRVINHSRSGERESRKVAKNDFYFPPSFALTSKLAPKLGSEMGQLDRLALAVNEKMWVAFAVNAAYGAPIVFQN